MVCWNNLGELVAPTTADNVIISTGHIVTITASTSITDLNLSATNSKLVINSSMTLTVVGTLRILVQLLMASTDLVQFVYGYNWLWYLTPTGTRPNVTIGDGLVPTRSLF
jgi:hypothetical protein